MSKSFVARGITSGGGRTSCSKIFAFLAFQMRHRRTRVTSVRVWSGRGREQHQHNVDAEPGLDHMSTWAKNKDVIVRSQDSRTEFTIGLITLTNILRYICLPLCWDGHDIAASHKTALYQASWCSRLASSWPTNLIATPWWSLGSNIGGGCMCDLKRQCASVGLIDNCWGWGTNAHVRLFARPSYSIHMHKLISLLHEHVVDRACWDDSVSFFNIFHCTPSLYRNICQCWLF
jgi:hypothetical protein